MEEETRRKNIGCCGTVRTNRNGFLKAVENDLPKKAERDNLKWMKKDSLLFVKWLITIKT